MKNISFLQLVLGVGGGLLIYSGIKNLDLPEFLHTLVTNPSKAFSSGYFFTAKTSSTSTAKPDSNPSRPI